MLLDRFAVGLADMTLMAAGFLGYAIIFFVRNFTDSFLKLGIGPQEINVGKDEIVGFSPEPSFTASGTCTLWSRASSRRRASPSCS